MDTSEQLLPDRPLLPAADPMRPVGIHLMPAGRDWDAVRISRSIGLEAHRAMGGASRAVICDSGGQLYWPVPPGTASGWDVPHTESLGLTTYVVVPSAALTTGPGDHWERSGRLPHRPRCPTRRAAGRGRPPLRAEAEAHLVRAHTIIKLADWTLGTDHTPGASPPIRETECTTCHERSEPSTGQLGPDSWAIAHTGATGHDGFREIVTAFLRVIPAPGNPLYRKSTEGAS